MYDSLHKKVVVMWQQFVLVRGQSWLKFKIHPLSFTTFHFNSVNSVL